MAFKEIALHQFSSKIQDDFREKIEPRIGNTSLQTSKKGLVISSPCSDLTCFIPSKAGENNVPSIFAYFAAHKSTNLTIIYY